VKKLPGRPRRGGASCGALRPARWRDGLRRSSFSPSPSNATNRAIWSPPARPPPGLPTAWGRLQDDACPGGSMRAGAVEGAACSRDGRSRAWGGGGPAARPTTQAPPAPKMNGGDDQERWGARRTRLIAEGRKLDRRKKECVSPQGSAYRGRINPSTSK